MEHLAARFEQTSRTVVVFCLYVFLQVAIVVATFIRVVFLFSHRIHISSSGEKSFSINWKTCPCVPVKHAI